MIRQSIFALDFVLTIVSAIAHLQHNQAQLPALKDVAKFEAQRPTGVAVSRTGRIFVNFPLWGDPHKLSVVEVMKDGTIKPYPDQQWNSWTEGGTVSPDKSFVCVQSVWVDDQDNLWVLDPASPRMQGVVKNGAKLVKINLETNQPEKIVAFDDTIAPEKSYLNDVRIDTKRDWAYLTDSGMGAIIAINLKSGEAHRLLEDHSSTKAEPNVTITVKGKQLRDQSGKTPQIHSDGIALSKDGEHLYYHALTGKSLYRVPTEALREESQSQQAVAQAVEKVGETVVTDGMLIDDAGNIYHTAIEQDAIVRWTPSKKLETVIKHERINWPDSMAMQTQAGAAELYFTTSQLQNMSKFGGDGKNAEPYAVFKIELQKHGGEKPLH
jgi:sugar lactone lactonase YvrE